MKPQTLNLEPCTKCTALTIAGSDSGGGAGIQADLNTFTSMGVWGTTAITCITAQNPDEVCDVQPVSPEMVALQIETVCKHYSIKAAKTGMLYSTEIVSAVADAFSRCNIPLLVVDPVMVATSGARLLKEDAVEELRERLFPMATVITPNVPEAEMLCGCNIDSRGSMKEAAKMIGSRFKTACIVKGGHLTEEIRGPVVAEAMPGKQRSLRRQGYGGQAGVTGSEIIDVLWDGESLYEYSVERVDAVNTHGTGCRFSAAMAGYLALGSTLQEAVKPAQEFVANTLKVLAATS